MDYLKTILVAVVAGLVVLLAPMAWNAISGQSFGAYDATTITNPVIYEDTVTLEDDLTVQGRNVTITTSNTATSSLIVGCKQTYATSTATPWREGILVVGTSSVMASGGTANGFVVAQYGTCPF